MNPSNTTEGPIISATAAPISTLPRFNLRKRPATCERPKVKLTSVNSAFLSGLFADVAKGQADTDTENTNPQDITQESDPRVNQTLPNKKNRVSMTMAMSYAGKSMMNLQDALVSPMPEALQAPMSPDSVDIFDIPFPSITKTGAPSQSPMERKDSLHYQLNCVSSYEASLDSVAQTVSEATKIAFPHLPATVSASSCNTLTRNLSDLQTFTTEKPQKDSYGWFVEMEEDHQAPTAPVKDPYASTTKTAELTFTATTAPKATNHEAEVEWAKAADTVDDVLGDFF